MRLILLSSTDFLRDPIWQFWGVIASIVIGIVSLLLGYIYYQKQRNRKDLTYEVIFDTSIFGIESNVGEKLELHFNKGLKGNLRFFLLKRLLSDLSVLIIRIKNSGDVAIAPQDFIEPIMINFGGDIDILYTYVLQTAPSNITVSLSHNSRSVILLSENFLLNCRESVTIKILLSGRSEKVNVTARIIGLEKVRESNLKGQYQERLFRTTPVILGILLLCILILNKLDIIQISWTIALLDAVLLASSILYSYLLNRSFRQR